MLYFIGLLPPQSIQDYATEIKQYFADNYDSKHAFKSPLHITLQPPFEWDSGKLINLEECLQKFVMGRNSIPIILDGYTIFICRIIGKAALFDLPPNHCDPDKIDPLTLQLQSMAFYRMPADYPGEACL